MKFVDRTGQKYGHLTVIERAENYVSLKGSEGVRWKCLCDCGKEVIVCSTSLVSGSTKSCGCYREHRLKKRNDIRIDGDISYVRFKDKEIIVDTSDLDIVRQDSWHIGKNGYVVSNKGKQTIHSLIMTPPKGMCVDHINHNKLDNRRCNLRVVSYSENAFNHKFQQTNTGHFFITKNKTTNYYMVNIDGKYIGGSFDLNEALSIRDKYIPKSEVFKHNYYLQELFKEYL